MDYFAGLDVSVKETSLCIVDDTGLSGGLAHWPTLSPTSVKLLAPFEFRLR
jgi:hypothetical protein